MKLGDRLVELLVGVAGGVPHAVRLQRSVEVGRRDGAVAVVDDAEVGRDPRRDLALGPERDAVEVLRRGEDLDLAVDADLLEVGRHALRVGRHLEAAVAAQRELEVGRVGGLEQRLGLGEILLALRHRLVGERVAGPHRAVVPDLRVLAPQPRGDLRPSEGERDRLAHAHVLEGRLRHVHVEQAVVGRADRQDLRAAAELPRAVVADLHREIDLAAAQRRDPGVVLEDRVLDRVDARLAAPVGVVGDEREPGLPAVLLELERPRAVHVRGPVAGLREIGGHLVGLGQDDRLVGHAAEQVREDAVGGLEVELDRRIVDLRRAAWREHPAVRRERLGVRAGQALERRHDVVCRHRRAVVELHTLAQLDGPRLRAVGGRPAGRQAGKDLRRLVDVDELLAGDVRDRERAEGLQQRRLERSVRRDAADPDRPAGRAALHASRRGERRLGPERDERGERRAHSQHASAHQELPAAHPAVVELVDQMVLELTGVATVVLDVLFRIAHAHTPFTRVGSCSADRSTEDSRRRYLIALAISNSACKPKWWVRASARA